MEELREKEQEAKEAAEAAAVASPKPFIEEDGGFSVVALVVLVFIVGASVFFQGITGGGIARFDNQDADVQACIKQATTRDEASACLPPVPLT